MCLCGPCQELWICPGHQEHVAVSAGAASAGTTPCVALLRPPELGSVWTGKPCCPPPVSRSHIKKTSVRTQIPFHLKTWLMFVYWWGKKKRTDVGHLFNVGGQWIVHHLCETRLCKPRLLLLPIWMREWRDIQSEGTCELQLSYYFGVGETRQGASKQDLILQVQEKAQRRTSPGQTATLCRKCAFAPENNCYHKQTCLPLLGHNEKLAGTTSHTHIYFHLKRCHIMSKSPPYFFQNSPVWCHQGCCYLCKARATHLAWCWLSPLRLHSFMPSQICGRSNKVSISSCVSITDIHIQIWSQVVMWPHTSHPLMC